MIQENYLETLAIIIAIVGLLLTFVSVYLNRKHQKFEKKVKIKQGALYKPELVAFFYSHNCPENIIFAFPMKKNTFYAIPLNLFVVNNGKKTARKIEVRIEIPYKVSNKETDDFWGFYKNWGVKEFNHSLHFTRTSSVDLFNLDFLNPKRAMNIGHMLLVNEPTINTNFEIPTISIGENKIILHSQYFILKTIRASIAYEDSNSIEKEINIAILNSSSNDNTEQLLREYNSNLAEARKMGVSRLTFFKRIKKRLSEIRNYNVQKYGLVQLDGDKFVSLSEKLMKYSDDSFYTYTALYDSVNGFIIPNLNHNV